MARTRRPLAEPDGAVEPETALATSLALGEGVCGGEGDPKRGAGECRELECTQHLLRAPIKPCCRNG